MKTILTIALTTVALTVLSVVAWRWRSECCSFADKAIDGAGDLVEKSAELRQSV